MTPPYWQEAVSFLHQQDKIISQLITAYPQQPLQHTHHNPFETLVKAVIGQQISVKAATTIYDRLSTQLMAISPHHFLELSPSQLRQCGLSRQKVEYLGNIASAFIDGILTPQQWHEMDDEQVIKQLTKIKGIGQWTAQMFLIFYLQRPDVLPLKDIGLVNIIKQHYGNLSTSEMITLAQRWQPYRTVAVWYLWLSLDGVAIHY
ncbi:DNA-3-methyladenine glycosylase [Geminocystis sp. NIES-3709]|uniref:DNA-3-methyladenine glycosylase family protein n=1 Tax=Geminocystis sp. NIES-3709 TaxID=1617448 RepID=UPI0005FCD5F2|nr:DNA-3-methyladenine glycosylase 2 family protein [Geminocystis sp. NIES-3709]BAQ67135.1 DNA-3-methyladenine glycosylase II [Geminocystis sp. NIES-3709]